jgi:hypothetical protein
VTITLPSDECNDYVTVQRTMHPKLFCAVVMRYRKVGDEYQAERVSRPVDEKKAVTLARLWATAEGLDYR